MNRDSMMDTDSQNSQRGHFVRVNGMDMFYEDYGVGRPLILLHGGTSTSQTWQPFVPILMPHFRVITPDSRAHGQSNNPAGVLSYRLMADDIAAFIQTLNLVQPFVFGYSDGGQIALELGMHYPTIPGALVIGAAWYKFSTVYLNAMKSAGFESPGGVNIKRIQTESPEWVEEMKRDHISSGDTDYWQTLLKQISAMWWTALDYTRKDFEKIVAPSLVLLGDRDGIIELQQAVDMYQFIPDAELFIIPNADHFTTQSEISMRIAVEFLLRHNQLPE